MDSQKPKSLFKIVVKDALTTLGVEIMVLVSFFVFYRLLADWFGTEGVGEYSLMRRVLAIFIPLAMLGLPEALGRYIAGTFDEEEKKGLITSGLAIAFASCVMLVVILNVNQKFTAHWVLGNNSYGHLIWPFTVLLVGLICHTFVYACLRGGLRIKAVNALQLLNLGVFPLILLSVAHKTAFSTFLVLLGAGHIVIAALFLFAAAPRFGAMKFYLRFASKLLQFGASRLIATLAAAALFSLGPIVAAHYVSISEVGYLSLSLALLIGVGSVASPLGSVLLPHVSSLVSRGEVDRVERGIYLLIGAVLQALLFFVGQFLVFVDYVLTIWMGLKFLPAAPIMAMTFSALVAYGFFVIAKNILDAVSARAVNSINTAISLGVMIAGMSIVTIVRPPGDVALMFAVIFAVSFNLLGVLTYVSVRKIFTFKLQEDFRHLLWGIILNAVAVCLAFLVRDYVTSNLAIFIIFQATLLATYGAALWILNFEWLKIVKSRVFCQKRKPVHAAT